MSESSGIVSGTVRVATIYSVGLHTLPQYIKSFITRYPQAKIDLAYRRTDEVYAGCLTGVTDMGIVTYPHKHSQIEIVPFAEERLVMISRGDYSLASLKKIPIERLRDANFI